MRKFFPIQTQDNILQRIQDNISSAFAAIFNNPTIEGNLLESVALVSGQDNYINHGLGRRLRLWMIARQSASATVWEVTSPGIDSILALRASANCTVSLWVA